MRFEFVAKDQATQLEILIPQGANEMLHTDGLLLSGGKISGVASNITDVASGQLELLA